MTSQTHRLRLVAAFAATYVIWGSTFLALRYAVAVIPPLLTIAMRCVGGAAVIAGWLAVRGQLRLPDRHELVTGLISGGSLFLVCHGLLALAEQRVPSGQAAVYMATIPLWLVVITAGWQRRMPGLPVITGLALGMVGMVVLTGGEGGASARDALVLVVAALAWAVGSLVGRHRGSATPVALGTVYQLTGGASLLIVISASSGELVAWHLSTVTARAIGALLFMILGGTVVGMGAYNWLLRVTTPAVAGSYAFVNPVVAVILAWAVADGLITVRTLASTACVVAAVVLCRLERTTSNPSSSLRPMELHAGGENLEFVRSQHVDWVAGRGL